MNDGSGQSDAGSAGAGNTNSGDNSNTAADAGGAGNAGNVAAGNHGATGNAGGDGGAPGAEGWYVGLPGADTLAPEARQFLHGKNFKDFGALVQTAAESDRMARGRHVLDRPAEGANIAEWNGWEQLGWNADRDAYVQANFKRPDLSDAEKQNYAEGLETALLNGLHGAKAPGHVVQPAFDAVMTEVRKVQADMAANVQAEKDTLRAALEKEWGADYEKNQALAHDGFKASGLSERDIGELQAFLNDSPALLKFFARIGQANTEAEFFTGPGNNGGRMTKAAAQARLNQMKADNDVYEIRTNPRHPRHAEVQAEWDRLIAATT